MRKENGARVLRLGVNIDHVATIRNARGGYHPDPLRAAHLAVAAGADGITAHLREDRRHISDDDIARLKRELTRPLNLEMAATDEMLAIALRHLPNACCLVPERREERTTEGGLDVRGGGARLQRIIAALKDAGIRVSLFIEPDPETIAASAEIGADIVELHTGRYCELALENSPGTAAEVRHVFTKYNGKLGSTGCVSYLFERKGMILVADDDAEIDVEKVMDLAIENGAEDVEENEGNVVVTTAFEDLHQVSTALGEAGLPVQSAELVMEASTEVKITDEKEAAGVLRLVNMLDDLDDVSRVSANFDIDDELMAKLDS